MKRGTMERSYISLSELLLGIKGMVSEAFPEPFWVKAEIRQYSPATAGHCYITLSESKDGKAVAEARSVIWKWKYPTIAATFRQATGSELRAGITVLVKVTLNFSELYGMTLFVEDIDPSFTLGEQALARKRAIEKLTKEGYMELQQELCIPPIPYNLAIISSPTAAGLQDFLHHLRDNEYGYVFNPVLFEAAMQGDSASASVVDAFRRIAALEESAGRAFDAVLLLRGGGSETDLACFDDYDMAVAIATCPSPVVTAIGHDKDYHIADMVANAYVKTPTALADLFINAYIAEDERIDALSDRIGEGVRKKMDGQAEALERMALRLARAVSGKFAAADRAVQALSGRIARGLLGKRHALERTLDERISRLRFAAGTRQAMATAKVSLVEARITGADPREILSRGYVLVTGGDNRILKSATRVHLGDRIGVRFSDGHLRATVNEVATEGEEKLGRVSSA